MEKEIIFAGNQPASIPKRYQLKTLSFSVYINTHNGTVIETCTLHFYHSQSLYQPFQRTYKLLKHQPIKNLFFDADENDFELCADTCKVISPVLTKDDEVVIIPVFIY